MHKLKIIEDKIYLDGFLLKSVKEYIIKRNADSIGFTEIIFTLTVSNSKLTVD